MRSVRFTPLNIAVAALVVYLGMQLIEGQTKLWQTVGVIVLIIVLILSDQFFRVMLKKLSRVWLIEGVFVVLAIIAIWLI